MCAFVTDIKRLPYTVCVCHIQYVSFTDRLCLSQTVCVCRRKSVSVTDSLFMSQTVFVRHRFFVFCQRTYMALTDSLCLSQKVFVFQSEFLLNTLLDHFLPEFYLFILKILVCPGFWNQQNQLCGPLEAGAPNLQNLIYFFHLNLDNLHWS